LLLIISRYNSLNEMKISNGLDLSNSHCLGNPIENSDFVVTLHMIQDLSNLEENQCSSFMIKHFVEVIPVN